MQDSFIFMFQASLTTTYFAFKTLSTVFSMSELSPMDCFPLKHRKASNLSQTLSKRKILCHCCIILSHRTTFCFFGVCDCDWPGGGEPFVLIFANIWIIWSRRKHEAWKLVFVVIFKRGLRPVYDKYGWTSCSRGCDVSYYFHVSSHFPTST